MSQIQPSSNRSAPEAFELRQECDRLRQLVRGLETRLERLEQRPSAWRRAAGTWAGVVLLGFAFAPLLAALLPRVAIAQEPVVKAPPGKQSSKEVPVKDSPAAGPEEEQAPPSGPQELTLRDERGRMRLWMGILPGGACGLGLYDEAGVARSELFLSNQGAARLLISDARGVGRALLGVGAEGQPLMQLANESGQSLCEAGVMADGSTRLRLRDPQSGKRMELRMLADGRPGFEVFGEDGRARISMGLSALDEPGLQLTDTSGRRVFER